jgi:hypothetical protein
VRAHRFLPLVLAFIFLLTNAYVLKGGIRPAGDSARYLEGADNLLHGQDLTSREAMFLGYIAVVAACQALGLGLPGIVLVQLVFAALAAWAQFDLGRSIVGRAAGFLAAGLLLVNLDVIRWNAYVLTESLYTSAVVLSTWWIYQAGQRKGYWYFAAGLVLLFAASLRPHGWLLLPIAGTYWIIALPFSWIARFLAIGGLLGSVLIAFVSVPGIGQGIDQSFSAAAVENKDPRADFRGFLARGVVIWGYADGNLTMPTGSVMGLRYAVEHPVTVIRLAGVRILTECAHVRPYFSAPHNLLILGYLLPLYSFAIVGFVSLARKSLCWLILAVVGSHLLFVGFTWADWDGRFLIYILPCFTVLAAGGIMRAYQLWRHRVTSGAHDALPVGSDFLGSIPRVDHQR